MPRLIAGCELAIRFCGGNKQVLPWLLTHILSRLDRSAGRGLCRKGALYKKFHGEVACLKISVTPQPCIAPAITHESPDAMHVHTGNHKNMKTKSRA